MILHQGSGVTGVCFEVQYSVGMRVQDLVVADHIERGQAQHGAGAFASSLCLAFFAADEAQYLLLVVASAVVASVVIRVVVTLAVGVVLRYLIRIDRFFDAPGFVDLA